MKTIGDLNFLSPRTTFSLSLFDQLSDDNPTVNEEREILKTYTRDDFKDSIRHEVSSLLNTRLTAKEERFQEENKFFLPYHYGIRDFQSFDLTNPLGRARLQNHIQTSLEHFEPRLRNVEVEFVAKDTVKRSVRIQIIADIMIQGDIETFSFPVSLQDLQK